MNTLKSVRERIWKNRRKTPVICLDTGTVYASSMDVERKTGIWGKSVLNCCDGKTTSASGKKWAYYEQ